MLNPAVFRNDYLLSGRCHIAVRYQITDHFRIKLRCRCCQGVEGESLKTGLHASEVFGIWAGGIWSNLILNGIFFFSDKSVLQGTTSSSQVKDSSYFMTP